MHSNLLRLERISNNALIAPITTKERDVILLGFYLIISAQATVYAIESVTYD